MRGDLKGSVSKRDVQLLVWGKQQGIHYLKKQKRFRAAPISALRSKLYLSKSENLRCSQTIW